MVWVALMMNTKMPVRSLFIIVVCFIFILRWYIVFMVNTSSNTTELNFLYPLLHTPPEIIHEYNYATDDSDGQAASLN